MLKAVVIQGELILWLRLEYFGRVGSIGRELNILSFLAVRQFPLQHALAIIRSNALASFDGSHLFDLHFAKSLTINALRQRQDKSFSLRADQFCFVELDDSCDVLGSFISEKVDCEFEAIALSLILKDELLIENETIIFGRRWFSCHQWPHVLNLHAAGKFDLHFDR